MASERLVGRCCRCYAKLLRFYPKPYRDRFVGSMQQTFNDLCRERVKANKNVWSLALTTFAETSAAIFKENASYLLMNAMHRKTTWSLKALKYSALSLGALMMAGIGALMILARGKGEDITGIVAPALLITFVSGVVAMVASVRQKRAQNT